MLGLDWTFKTQHAIHNSSRLMAQELQRGTQSRPRPSRLRCAVSRTVVKVRCLLGASRPSLATLKGHRVSLGSSKHPLRSSMLRSRQIFTSNASIRKLSLSTTKACAFPHRQLHGQQ